MKTLRLLLALCLISASAYAEVVRVEVISRKDIPEYGYEEVAARAHFWIDPTDSHNKAIADVDKLPLSKDGGVEFTADIVAYWPKNGDGNNVALVDVVNRGRPTAFKLNLGAATDRIGDGFLMKQGFMIICIGWEFDAPMREGMIRIQAPVATDNGAPITGTVRASFTPDKRDATYTVANAAAYAPRDNWVTNVVATLPGVKVGGPLAPNITVGPDLATGLVDREVRVQVQWLQPGETQARQLVILNRIHTGSGV